MVNRAASHHDSDPTATRQRPDSNLTAARQLASGVGQRRIRLPGAGIDPAENHQPGGDNRHDKNDKKRPVRQMGEDQPRQHRVECRPQPPQRLGGEVAGLHPRRGNMVNQHILPGGINHFPEGEDRRRDPPRPQAGAREHKAHKADHKADGAEGH